MPSKSRSRSRSKTKYGKKKVLPPVDKNGPHLRDYGYKVNNKQTSRRKSLDSASKKLGRLAVIRRMNLIRNYEHQPNIKNTMSKDIKYLSGKYKQEKSK